MAGQLRMRMIHKYNCCNSPVARKGISREDEVRQSSMTIVAGNLARHAELSLKSVVKIKRHTVEQGEREGRKKEKAEKCIMALSS